MDAAHARMVEGQSILDGAANRQLRLVRRLEEVFPLRRLTDQEHGHLRLLSTWGPAPGVPIFLSRLPAQLPEKSVFGAGRDSRRCLDRVLWVLRVEVAMCL